MDPLYLRIAEDLRDQIKNGQLVSGDQLPTEPELQRNYSERAEFRSNNVSRNTVRDAVNLLVTAGLVVRRLGQGTFVAERPEPFASTLSGNPEGGEASSYRQQVAGKGRRRQESPPQVEPHYSTRAPELGLDDKDMVVGRHQERFIDGIPYSLQTSYYPRRFVESGADRLESTCDIPEGAASYLREELGIKQVGWRDSLLIRHANSQEIEFFDLPPKVSTQVLEARRTAFDECGKPIRLTVTVYATDRNQLVYETGQVPQADTDS